MRQSKKQDLIFHLSQLDDPRSGDNKKYKLIEILFISVCALLCGCESWTEIEDYGRSKREWFSTFLELKNGIPSHDTFRRVFCIVGAGVKRGRFRRCSGPIGTTDKREF